MCDAPQMAVRWLTALEELVAEGGWLIRTMEFTKAAAMQERAMPLVAKLCELAGQPGMEALQPRIIALLDLYRQSQQCLTSQLGRWREELGRIEGARRQLRRMVPVYSASGGANVPRLNAAA